MKLLLTLTSDKGDFITHIEVPIPNADLDLSPQEFTFRHCVFNKAVEQIQGEARLGVAIKRFGGFVMPSGVC